MKISFEERSLWIQLSGMMLTLGGYFAVAGALLFNDDTKIATFVPLFIVATVVMIVISAAGHAAAAIASTPEGRDDRDRAIAQRAEARSSWLLAVGVMIAVGCLATAVNTAWVANILLLSMFLSQALCYTLQLVAHRRGF